MGLLELMAAIPPSKPGRGGQREQEYGVIRPMTWEDILRDSPITQGILGMLSEASGVAPSARLTQDIRNMPAFSLPEAGEVAPPPTFGQVGNWGAQTLVDLINTGLGATGLAGLAGAGESVGRQFLERVPFNQLVQTARQQLTAEIGAIQKGGKTPPRGIMGAEEGIGMEDEKSFDNLLDALFKPDPKKEQELLKASRTVKLKGVLTKQNIEEIANAIESRWQLGDIGFGRKAIIATTKYSEFQDVLRRNIEHLIPDSPIKEALLADPDQLFTFYGKSSGHHLYNLGGRGSPEASPIIAQEFRKDPSAFLDELRKKIHSKSEFRKAGEDFLAILPDIPAHDADWPAFVNELRGRYKSERKAGESFEDFAYRITGVGDFIGRTERSSLKVIPKKEKE